MLEDRKNVTDIKKKRLEPETKNIKVTITWTQIETRYDFKFSIESYRPTVQIPDGTVEIGIPCYSGTLKGKKKRFKRFCHH